MAEDEAPEERDKEKLLGVEDLGGAKDPLGGTAVADLGGGKVASALG